MMEGLDLLKDIPGFKAIVRAILKSQMKHLVEQLSEHGGEEAMLFTASVSDGTFHHLGSTVTKGFLDTRENIKSQFLGHCMKGAQDTEVPNENAASVVDTTSDKISLNTVANTSRRSGRSVTLPLRYISSPVAHKGVGETTETEMNAIQTSSSKEGSKVASPKKGRGKKSRKRPTATFTSETPLKRSAIAETSTSESPFKNSTISKTVTQALNVLSNETGLEDMDGSVKIENHFNDLDNTQMEESDLSGTLSLDLGRKPSLDGPGKISESNELDHLVQDFKVKIEPVDDESADFEENADELDVGLNSEMVGDGSNTTATEPGPLADANTKKRSDPHSRICRVCGKTLSSYSSLSQHERRHEKKAPYTCCGKLFFSRANFKGHLCSQHGRRKEFICKWPKCNAEFGVKAALNSHMTRHTHEAGFHCSLCNSWFQARAEFLDHQGKHNPELSKRHQCSVCHDRFSFKSSLYRHKKMHKLKKPQTNQRI